MTIATVWIGNDFSVLWYQLLKNWEFNFLVRISVWIMFCVLKVTLIKIMLQKMFILLSPLITLCYNTNKWIIYIALEASFYMSSKTKVFWINNAVKCAITRVCRVNGVISPLSLAQGRNSPGAFLNTIFARNSIFLISSSL